MVFTKIYDLSQPISQECPGWPEFKPTNILREYNSAIHGFNAETVTMNTHTGTHLDAPFHFFDQGAKIDQLPLENFSGEAIFLDFRNVSKDMPISAEQLQAFSSFINADDIVILVTGWSAKRAMQEEYIFQWPYLDGAGAEFLLSRHIKGVGCDTLSLGGWGSPAKGRPCHEVILGAGKFIVEELKVPDLLLDGQHHLFSCFPILLRDCGGSWTRAVVYELK